MESSKKMVLLSIILLIIIFLVSNINLNLTGQTTKNKLPTVTLSRPVEDSIINSKTINFMWRFIDTEDDEQTAYILQISNNNTFNPSKDIIQEEIGITNKNEREVTLKNIHNPYYWRVKVKDKTDWGEFPKYSTFSLDLTSRTCTDGTPFYQCSKEKPFYCNGDLFRRCSECSCPTGFKCQSDETCIEAPNCVDATKENACSLNKPKYCENNNLIDKCSVCGCNTGENCENEICKKPAVVEQPIQIKEVQKTFIQKILDFFKNLK